MISMHRPIHSTTGHMGRDQPTRHTDEQFYVITFQMVAEEIRVNSPDNSDINHSK
jgi:hypothetical protein